ncbi:DUF5659 domain-containing protein [Caproiciproducens faecalis]|uniref:DUF5659 domain-containing protein n=1 Tax=Caproiciproducens faecalis TaxID=2820301 RepID=UPI0038B28639
MIKIQEKQYYIIRSLSMANYLVRHGYDIKKVSDSEKNNQFKVFLFSDSDELRSAMAQFNQEV